MNFFGSGSAAGVADMPTEMTSGMDESQNDPNSAYPPPVLALDRLKQAGVPLRAQMSPYLKVGCVITVPVHICALIRWIQLYSRALSQNI